jgi:DNA-binding transcriptional ArsR family regulator
LPANPSSETLCAVFSALSDPIRQQILARLARGTCSVSELGAPFSVSAPAISKHLNVLEGCGLIVRWKQGRTHYCRLVSQPLQLARDWLDQQRSFWEQQFDRLDDFLSDGESTWASQLPQKETPPSGSGTDSKLPRKGSSRPGPRRKR